MTPLIKTPTFVLACQVFQGVLEKHITDNFVNQIIYLDYGLHVFPKKLNQSLQSTIDDIEPGLIILGYGLCGNGLDGIRAGDHTLLIPRADDCIAIFLGSYKAYLQEFNTTPGTYYLTKGWLESGSNPLQESKKYAAKYGHEQAEWIMEQQYQHYERLAFVAHSLEDLEKYRPQALEVSQYCQRWGMRYEEIQGSEDYIKNLIEVAVALEKADGEFIVIPPGGELKQSHFIRS